MAMETTNHLITTSAAAGSSSCHTGGRSTGGWLSQRRGLILGGGAVVAAVALALGQHWLTIAALAPLLYLLPCALMMYMCMKGHGHHVEAPPAPTTDKPGGTDAGAG
jgi:uncharacterized membrane protein YfcA